MRWLHGRHRVPWPNDSLQRTLRPFLYEAALPTPIISSCPPSLMSPHQWPVIRYLRPLRRNQIQTHHGYKGYRDSNGPKNTSGIPKSIRLPKLRRLERKKNSSIRFCSPSLFLFHKGWPGGARTSETLKSPWTVNTSNRIVLITIDRVVAESW